MNSCRLCRCQQICVAVHLVDGRVAEESVAESRRMGHQLTHRGRMVGIGEDQIAAGVHALIDLEVCKLRNEFGNRVRGQPLALLIEDHHRDAGNGLGHGEVAENHILRHGCAGREVARSIGPVIDDLAVARKDGDDTGEVLLIDLLLHHRVQALKPL